MALTAERVEAIFHDSLFRDDEEVVGAVEVDGILNRFGFHPDRIAAHKPEVAAMLTELPDSFQQTGGGGMSFLNACIDKNDVQWTGLHQTMDHLFCLGMATNLVSCVLPRDMWSILPGGMPYYVVSASAIEARRAETPQSGSVHESADPKGDAQTPSGEVK